jgi:hypothetical protein
LNGNRRVGVGVFVTVGVAFEFESSSGGSGKTAYSLGGPVSLSGSGPSFIFESALRELLRDGGARRPEIVGPKVSDSGDRAELDVVVVGLVPARFLDVMSCEGVCVVTMKGPLRSWAAENEGRKRRLAATDPLTSGNEGRLSPFSGAPFEIGVPPRGEADEATTDSVVLTSVEPLPLRFRRLER